MNPPFPSVLKLPSPRDVQEHSVLFGALCYSIGSAAYGHLVDALRQDLPGALVWSPKRSKSQ